MPVVIEGPWLHTSAQCAPILRSLPEWFGIPEAVAHYIDRIEQLPTFLAQSDGATIGFMSVLRHFPHAAELYVLAVLPEWHRRGVGRALLTAAEAWLSGNGVEYLQVKTLGPSRPNDAYDRTRGFYEAQGFRPLEELTAIWGESNPCLILVKRLAAPPSSRA